MALAGPSVGVAGIGAAPRPSATLGANRRGPKSALRPSPVSLSSRRGDKPCHGSRKYRPPGRRPQSFLSSASTSTAPKGPPAPPLLANISEEKAQHDQIDRRVQQKAHAEHAPPCRSTHMFVKAGDANNIFTSYSGCRSLAAKAAACARSSVATPPVRGTVTPPLAATSQRLQPHTVAHSSQHVAARAPATPTCSLQSPRSARTRSRRVAFATGAAEATARPLRPLASSQLARQQQTKEERQQHNSSSSSIGDCHPPCGPADNAEATWPSAAGAPPLASPSAMPAGVV